MSEHKRTSPSQDPTVLTHGRVNSSEDVMRTRLERLLKVAMDRGDLVSMYNLQHRIHRLRNI